VILDSRHPKRQAGITTIDNGQPQKSDPVIADMNLPGLTADQLAADNPPLRPDMAIAIHTGSIKRLPAVQASLPGIRAFLPMLVTVHEHASTVRDGMDRSDESMDNRSGL
jgi:hypothetical protein